MNEERSGLLVVVLAVVLLFSMVSMASAAQTWYMIDAAGATGANYEMHKGDGLGTFDDVTIADGASAIWAADQSVAVDGGINMNGAWTGVILADAGSATASGSFDVEIGRLSGGTFTKVKTDQVVITGRKNYSISFAPGNFPLAKGDYLALKLTDTTSDSKVLRIFVRYFSASTSPSYLTYANNDPAYPVPELSTILLTCTGVLMLGGFVIYSRRRNDK